MSTLTHAAVPPHPALEEQSGWWPSERTTKARLRAFFSRTRSENKISKDDAARDDDQPSAEPKLAPLESSSSSSTTNGSTLRTRSTTWSSRGFRSSQRSLKRVRPRTLTHLDPPPFIQASCTQAKLHGFLEVPSSPDDALFRTKHRRRNSVTGESPTRSNLDSNTSTPVEENTRLAGVHRRNWSGAGTCALSRKVFVLTRSGYILQYSVGGLNDRLPEQILELGPQSIAFASDAVPGRHYALCVSHDQKGGTTASLASKASRSKFSFRQNDSQGLVQDLLLVFDSAITLETWLTTIRREIELLGDLENRPHSRENDSTQRSHPILKPQKSLPAIPQSSRHSPVEKFFKGIPPSTKLLPPMPKWAASSRNVSSSTADSSVHTDNDLDNIRDTSFSDDQSTGTADTSIAGSVFSKSPAVDSFSTSGGSFREPLTPTSRGSRLLSPTQDDTGELSMFMAAPRKSRPNDPLVPKPVRSNYHGKIAQQRTKAGGENRVIDHALFVQPRTEIDTTISSRPVSVVAPLPEPDHWRKSSGRYRSESQATNSRPNTPVSSRPTSSWSKSSSSVSQESPLDSRLKRTPYYTLFPSVGPSGQHEGRTESTIETTLLEIPPSLVKAPSNVRLSNPPRRNKQIKSQKSMPSLVRGSIPPSGPPPAGPLPALPPGVPPAVSRPKTSQRNHSAGAATATASYPNRSTKAPRSPQSHGELSPPPSSSTTTTTTTTTAASSPTAASHSKSPSSLYSVDSVRDVTAWLTSPKIAAFAATFDPDPPQLEVVLPGTPGFCPDFGRLVP